MRNPPLANQHDEVNSEENYWCDTPEQCWRRCPEPEQDGGSTSCSCENLEGEDNEEGQYWCTVTYYGPGEHPWEEGQGGGDDSCTEDQRAIAAEYNDPALYTGAGRWPCDIFDDETDTPGATGIHDHRTVYLASGYITGKESVISYADNASLPGTRIDSSWRCPIGNDLVGGVPDSQHMEGVAGDFHNSGFHGADSTAYQTYRVFAAAARDAGAGYHYQWDTGRPEHQVKVRRYIHFT